MTVPIGGFSAGAFGQPATGNWHNPRPSATSPIVFPLSPSTNHVPGMFTSRFPIIPNKKAVLRWPITEVKIPNYRQVVLRRYLAASKSSCSIPLYKGRLTTSESHQHPSLSYVHLLPLNPLYLSVNNGHPHPPLLRIWIEERHQSHACVRCPRPYSSLCRPISQ